MRPRAAGETGARHASDNLRGMGWMVLAMAAFALEDALLKQVARMLPIGQVLVLFGIGGALVFGLYRREGMQPLWHADARSKPMWVRAGFEITGRLFYVLAIALTPLSSATAILQATPVLVVLGARFYFGERVGAVRWVAVLLGLAGVAVVLRPTAGDFSVLSLLTVIGMMGFAGRDLASRAVPVTLGTRHLGFYGFLAVVVAGALYAVWQGQAWVWPDRAGVVALVVAVLVGTGAYASLMKAMRTGDVAAVTPLRYTRLLFGVGMGVVAFGEQVDAITLAGCAVILLAGLLLTWDARRSRRRVQARP